MKLGLGLMEAFSRGQAWARLGGVSGAKGSCLSRCEDAELGLGLVGPAGSCVGQAGSCVGPAGSCVGVSVLQLGGGGFWGVWVAFSGLWADS